MVDAAESRFLIFNRMPTILTHPAVPLAFHPWFADLPRRAVAAGIIVSILPDIDVIAFPLGVPYGATLGHRGFTHSILFAVVIAIIAAPIVGRERRGLAFAYLFLCAVSHGLLDALTNGGLGIAFYSPFDLHRFFFPWRPIEVSPIGASSFIRRGGLTVLGSEVRSVWLPCAMIACVGLVWTRFSRRKNVEG